MCDSIAPGHNTGSPMELEARKHLHLVLWEQAAHDFERSEFAGALDWYNYSLSMFPPSEKDKNIAKLQVGSYLLSRMIKNFENLAVLCLCLSQRNRCSCYIQLKEYEMATEAIQSAKRQDPHCPQTQFLIFKLALLLNKEEEGD